MPRSLHWLEQWFLGNRKSKHVIPPQLWTLNLPFYFLLVRKQIDQGLCNSTIEQAIPILTIYCDNQAVLLRHVVRVAIEIEASTSKAKSLIRNPNNEAFLFGIWSQNQIWHIHCPKDWIEISLWNIEGMALNPISCSWSLL